MSKTQRGVRDRTGPYAGSYEASIGGGRREQCYKDEDKIVKSSDKKIVDKIGKIKFWGGK